MNDMQPRGLVGGILPSFRTAKKQRVSESRIIIRHWFDPKAADMVSGAGEDGSRDRMAAKR